VKTFCLLHILEAFFPLAYFLFPVFLSFHNNHKAKHYKHIRTSQAMDTIKYANYPGEPVADTVASSSLVVKKSPAEVCRHVWPVQDDF